jgi:Ca2+-binding RTX toxin-like protein
MSHTITLSKDYGYSSYKAPSGLDAGTTIDASDASWIVSNIDKPINLYPFQVNGAGAGLMIQGGTIVGKVPQTGDWKDTYVNSAAMRIGSSNSFTIDDWTITQPWDGIRVSGSGTFLIEDTYIANSRDDAVENDDVLSGTIRDSLFNGVFSGVSLGDGDVDGSDNVVTMDGMLLRSKSYLYKGEMTHGSPFKLDKSTGADDVVPSLRFINNVVAIEDVNHFGQERLQRAWDKTIESSGNVFLNLSDTPLPSDYPKPGAGWTILQGQAARDYWETARKAWIDSHAGDGEEPATDVGEQPVLGDGEATFEGVSFKGGDDDETIIGNALDNNIEGGNGNDVMKGGAGNDTIRGDQGVDTYWGGAGNDTFFFKRTSDSREQDGIDTIMDFTKGDKLDLSTIDANSRVSGDQAFELITGEFTKTPGQLKFMFDAASGNTVVTGNTDTDLAAEFTILLKGNIALAASDFVL